MPDPTACGLGVDLGGSSAKLVLASADGEVFAQETVAMATSGHPGSALAPVAAALDRLQAMAATTNRRVTGLGCGVAGLLDPARGTVLAANIVALDKFPLAKWLHDRMQIPVQLDNDACYAASAEAALGPARGIARVLVVTVGSGIGVVLVVDGAVVRIHHGVTGEAGHLIVDPASEQRCPLGCRGCLETVASAPAIAREGRRQLAGSRAGADALTAEGVSVVAAGDAVAAAIISEAGRWLGLGLASWAALYSPDLIVLGGGVAQAGVGWLQAAATSMREAGWPYLVDNLPVSLTSLGRHAGAIGAAMSATRLATTRPASAGPGTEWMS